MPEKLYRKKLASDEGVALEEICDNGTQNARKFKRVLVLLLSDEGPKGPVMKDAEFITECLPGVAKAFAYSWIEQALASSPGFTREKAVNIPGSEIPRAISPHEQKRIRLSRGITKASAHLWQTLPAPIL